MKEKEVTFMQKKFFKNKVTMCAAMMLIGCMPFGSTAMAATSYSFSVKKGDDFSIPLVLPQYYAV